MAVYTTDQVVSMMAESDPESGDESNISEDPDFPLPLLNSDEEDYDSSSPDGFEERPSWDDNGEIDFPTPSPPGSPPLSTPTPSPPATSPLNFPRGQNLGKHSRYNLYT